MSVIATALRHMLAAGMAHDAIVAAVIELEALQPKDEQAERRRARDRERKALRNSAESAETPSSPPPSPRPPTTPTPTRDITTSGARAQRRCPASWSPTPADLAVGAGEGFSPGELERELAKFRDHTFSTARSDWSATFRNWLRNANPRKAHERHSHQKTPRDDRIGRMLAGAVAAIDR